MGWSAAPPNRGYRVWFAALDSRLEFVPLIEPSQIRRGDEIWPHAGLAKSMSENRTRRTLTIAAALWRSQLPSTMSRMGVVYCESKNTVELMRGDFDLGWHLSVKSF